jgi:hypothetical protein
MIVPVEAGGTVMSASQGITNARTVFESSIRKMGPGYAATINGVSNPIRINQSVQAGGGVDNVRYRHVIDTWA